MPSDQVLKVMNITHKAVLAITGGRAGWRAGNMPVIKLTTVGRKSGQHREIMLTCPVVEGDVYVVVASRGGDDVHPAWFLNLRDNPTVWVEAKGEPRHQRRARVATDPERDRLWPEITANYTGYANYQSKTDRKIPVVFLERV